MVGDRGIENLRPGGLEARQRTRLVRFHHPAVADDVRGEDGGEPAPLPYPLHFLLPAGFPATLTGG